MTVETDTQTTTPQSLDDFQKLETQALSQTETPSTEEKTEAPAAEAVAAPDDKAPEAPAWAPNTKVKVLDEEKEIPDYIAKAMTKDNEKDVREIFEKAYGLDAVKQSRDEFKAQLEQLSEEVLPHYEQLKEGLQDVINLRDKGDLESLFEKLGISEDAVAKFIMQRAEYYKLPAEQRQVHEQRRQQARQLAERERAESTLRAEVESMKIQQGQMLLNTALSQPQVMEVSARYDQLFGPGSFKQEVLDTGIKHEITYRQTLPVEQAVSQALARVQKILALSPTQAGQPNVGQSNTQQTTNAAMASTQVKKPTLPSVGQGANASTVTRNIASIKDLEAAYEEMVSKRA